MISNSQKVHDILKKLHALDFSHKGLDNYTGILIVLEGNDGAGKTTLSKKLVGMINILNDIDVPAYYVRTPGGTEVGEVLRNILLDPEYDICNMAEAFLFQAQLAQCIMQVILPSLKKGHIVICDRLVFSTLAYQACGRELDMIDMWNLQLQSLQGVWPNFGFMLRNPIKKESSGDRIEEAGKGFSERVATYYDLIMETNESAADLMEEINVFPDPNETAEYLYDRTIKKITKHLIQHNRRKA